MTPMKHGSYKHKTAYNHPPITQDSDKSSSHMISADDAEYPREYRTLGNGTRRFSNVGLVHTSERRHTVIAAQSLEALTGIQKSDMERKREAFLDHLKHKYPHHATAIRGQQERLREQTRSPRHSQSTQSGLAEQAAKLPYASAESLESMSEAEVPLGFTRSNRFRQSLPLSRSSSQTKLRSPGVLFLQYGDETRRVHVTHEISNMDTLHALIAHIFPQKLTVSMLKSPNTAILIKDESRNVFYELEDVRDIQDRSIIKIFRKEPIYAPYPTSHLMNGDLRRDMVYTSRDSSPTRRLSGMSPGPSPPPGLHTASPSRSRMSYSGARPPSYTGSPAHHGSQPVSPSPSAILERRDVKPDEDLSNKGVVLVKSEGLYADPYNMVQEGRLSIASTQSLAGMQDPFSYPGGLYRRGSMRSLSTYSAAGLQGDIEDTYYKAGHQMYSEAYGTGLGYRLPPSSPQKMVELQSVQPGPSPHSTYSAAPTRSSPVRQTFRKEAGASVAMETSAPAKQPRNPGPAMVPDGLPGPGDRTSNTVAERPLSGFSSPLTVNDPETRDRMEAMEKQIASLTGLVQNALLRGNEGDPISEKAESVNGSSGTGTLSPSVRNAMTSSGPVASPPPTAITKLQIQLHLHHLQQNASDLRAQLLHLRKLQLHSLDTMKMMMKRMETEINVRVTEAVRKQEDPLHRQRALVEEERQRYLNEEEMIVQQLNDLEKAVEELQRDLSLNQRLVTGQELEEKALVLRRLGETLTDLKAQFPSLQSKMRVILRVEVEAVKFLKEEPHRLDILLKRCKSVTDSLGSLRRQTNDALSRGSEENSIQSPKHTNSDSRSSEFEIPTSPPLNYQELHTPPMKTWQPHSSGSAAHLSHTSPAHTSRSSNPPGMGQAQANRGDDSALASNKRSTDRVISVEAAERDWEEKRASLTQFSNKDINRLLEETQAELMKAIPDLGFGNKSKLPSVSAEQKPAKPQHVQKTTTKIEANGRRHSEELTVHKYRTEKPSKSPPPPPPRRSFPSVHGLTTGRSGEVIVTNKKEASLKKAESDDTETQRPHVKLRRTMSDIKPPSTPPPIVASAVRDDEDEEERIMAELEVFQRSPVPLLGSQAVTDQVTDIRREGTPARGWKETESPVSPASAQLPVIVLSPRSSWTSERSSPEVEEPRPGAVGDSDVQREDGASGVCELPMTELDSLTTWSQQKELSAETTGLSIPCEGQPEDLESSDDPLSSSERLFIVEHQSSEAKPVQPCDDGEPALSTSSEEDLDSPSPRAEARSPAGQDQQNVAFIITESQIQALSGSEVQEIVSAKGEEVQTVNVYSHNPGRSPDIEFTPQDQSKGPIVSLDNKPIIIIFPEAMDIHTAYKRLSTVFEECDEDFQAVLGESGYRHSLSFPDAQQGSVLAPIEEVANVLFEPKADMSQSPVPVDVIQPDSEALARQCDPDTDSNPLKIRFPKRRLNALTKAIECGTRTGQKTLQVVIYEEEEKMDQETGQRQMATVKKFEIQQLCKPPAISTNTYPRTEDIKNKTYRRLDSLEETIRELESTISEISQHSSTDYLFSKDFLTVSKPEESPEQLVDDPELFGGDCPPGRGVQTEASSALDPRPLPSPTKKSPTSRTKPPLMPKPHIPSSNTKAGSMPSPITRTAIPPAPKLKPLHGSTDKMKMSKQREEYLNLQRQQQGSQQVVYF